MTSSPEVAILPEGTSTPPSPSLSPRASSLLSSPSSSLPSLPRASSSAQIGASFLVVRSVSAAAAALEDPEKFPVKSTEDVWRGRCCFFLATTSCMEELAPLSSGLVWLGCWTAFSFPGARLSMRSWASFVSAAFDSALCVDTISKKSFSAGLITSWTSFWV